MSLMRLKYRYMKRRPSETGICQGDSADAPQTTGDRAAEYLQHAPKSAGEANAEATLPLMTATRQALFAARAVVGLRLRRYSGPSSSL